MRREVGEGVKVSKSKVKVQENTFLSRHLTLEETERQLEGLKSRLLKDHGEEVQLVNGFRSGEIINGWTSSLAT